MTVRAGFLATFRLGVQEGCPSQLLGAEGLTDNAGAPLATGAVCAGGEWVMAS